MKAAEAKPQLDIDIIETRKAIVANERELEKAKNSFPIDTRKVVECINKINALKEGQKILTALSEELFPAEDEKNQ